MALFVLQVIGKMLEYRLRVVNMKNSPKLYFITLSLSILLFVLEAFFLKLEGAIGLIICIICLYLFVGSIIRLIRLSQIFSDEIMDRIDILFF